MIERKNEKQTNWSRKKIQNDKIEKFLLIHFCLNQMFILQKKWKKRQRETEDTEKERTFKTERQKRKIVTNVFFGGKFSIIIISRKETKKLSQDLKELCVFAELSTPSKINKKDNKKGFLCFWNPNKI